MNSQSIAFQADFMQAVSFHRAGRLVEAEQSYRRILQAQPEHFDCRHLLGVICAQRGNHAEAVRQIDIALEINPNAASAHNNRGSALLELRRPDEALASYERATALKPDFAEAFYSRGNALRELKRPDEALASYDRAIALRPNYAEALNNRGFLLSELGRPGEALVSCERAIALKPDYAGAFNNRGNALRELKRPDEALASYDRAIALWPNHAEAFNNRGIVLTELKRPDEALASCERAIALKPDYAEAFDSRGNAFRELKRSDEALASYDRAIALKPNHAEALYNRGILLSQLKRPDEALASYERAIALKPDFAEAFNGRGNAFWQLRRLDEALASYDRAIALKRDHADAFNNRGVALRELKRPDEALASYDRAIALRPDYAEAFYNRGILLSELGRPDEALASCEQAIALMPGYAEAFDSRGSVLWQLRRPDEALVSLDRAIALKPDYADAFNNRGVALWQLRRLDEALASFDRAIALKPDDADAFSNRGVVLRDLQRLDEALASFDRAVAARADHPYALGRAADCVIKLCDWDRRARFVADLNAHVSSKKSIVAPLTLLAYSDDPGLQLQYARNNIESEVPFLPRPLWTGETWRHDKLRVAYLSADFRQHAVAQLMAGLFEQHDRSRFEIIAMSFGVDDKSELRKRLVAAFDQFYDVRMKSDGEVAKLLHDLQVDIAIDLMGHTLDSRPGILAYRPVPIQVAYLGFPGTTGAQFIDYVVADKTVVPFEHQPFYTERIVHLPDCYQVNDTKRNIAEGSPSRQEAGLPETGFVFCCFNNNWKITPEMFGVWMQLLRAVEGSVLWLLRGNEGAERNLRKEAQARGIDPLRLVFAGHLPLDKHLARHRLADLFLDTLPYNAHTTASDALWTGLPVLTCKGTSFSGRVAASLLYAVGLPELVTHRLEEYAALALKLATDPPHLQSIRRKLEANRLTYPLFDTDRFRRHIEAAYATMWETWQRREPPASFAVERLG